MYMVRSKYGKILASCTTLDPHFTPLNFKVKVSKQMYA